MMLHLGPGRGYNGPPGRGEQCHVQGDGQRVPGIVYGSDGRDGVHGPVEAQPPGVDKQPEVLGGQVEERERPGYQAGRLGGRVVGGREHRWAAVAHQRHPGEQQAGSRARQDRQRPEHSTGVLQNKMEHAD